MIWNPVAAPDLHRYCGNPDFLLAADPVPAAPRGSLQHPCAGPPPLASMTAASGMPSLVLKAAMSSPGSTTSSNGAVRMGLQPSSLLSASRPAYSCTESRMPAHVPAMHDSQQA